MCRGGTLISRFRICLAVTASRCSMMASMCQPGTNGVAVQVPNAPALAAPQNHARPLACKPSSRATGRQPPNREIPPDGPDKPDINTDLRRRQRFEPNQGPSSRDSTTTTFIPWGAPTVKAKIAAAGRRCGPLAGEVLHRRRRPAGLPRRR